MHVRLGPFYVAHAIHSVETRSLPTLAHCFPRNFTFYVALPIRFIARAPEAGEDRVYGT